MMKWLFISTILFVTGPKEIAKINKLKREAETAYAQGNFELAMAKYQYLRDSMQVDDPNLLLNLAHSHYQLADSASAREIYTEVATGKSAAAKSIALQQLGVMAKQPETLPQSLQYMKAALKADPTNEDARYDYEVVKKLIEKQKQEQQQNQNQDQEQQDQEQQDQQNQDQQNQQNQEQNQEEGEQEQQDQQQQQSEESDEDKEGEEQEQQEQQEGEESEEQQQQEQSVKEKLEQMNISEEKARMILEALRNNEIQYIQQQKRKAKKRPPSGKPDW